MRDNFKALQKLALCCCSKRHHTHCPAIQRDLVVLKFMRLPVLLVESRESCLAGTVPLHCTDKTGTRHVKHLNIPQYQGFLANAIAALLLLLLVAAGLNVLSLLYTLQLPLFSMSNIFEDILTMVVCRSKGVSQQESATSMLLTLKQQPMAICCLCTIAALA